MKIFKKYLSVALVCALTVATMPAVYCNENDQAEEVSIVQLDEVVEQKAALSCKKLAIVAYWIMIFYVMWRYSEKLEMQNKQRIEQIKEEYEAFCKTRPYIDDFSQYIKALTEYHSRNK